VPARRTEQHSRSNPTVEALLALRQASSATAREAGATRGPHERPCISGNQRSRLIEGLRIGSSGPRNGMTPAIGCGGGSCQLSFKRWWPMDSRCRRCLPCGCCAQSGKHAQARAYSDPWRSHRPRASCPATRRPVRPSKKAAQHQRSQGRGLSGDEAQRLRRISRGHFRQGPRQHCSGSLAGAHISCKLRRRDPAIGAV